MALSGTVTTNSYDGRYYKFTWEATQSVTANTSTIEWTLEAVGGSSSWYAERTLKLTISSDNTLSGNTTYSKTVRVERYAGEITTGKTTVSHNTEGKASFYVSIQAAVYVSDVNCTGSGSFSLNNIPRKSTLSVADGTLNKAQTLTVARQSTSFTHTITAKCGDDTRTVCTKSTNTSIAFTPPLAWAEENTTGTDVSVTYTITTYSGSTSVGVNTYDKKCTIPDSVKPSCKIAVSDIAGYASTYGYLKGLSKFKIVVTPTTSYGSAIASYKVTADGSTYTTATVTTSVIEGTGTLTITATVTDKRGRTGTASTNVQVINYNPPKIEYLKVKRVNAAGDDDDQGEFIRVQCNTIFTYLNGKNKQQHQLSYSKTNENNWTSTILELSVEDAPEGEIYSRYSSFTFPADTGSSYKVALYASDNFKISSKNAVASTAFTIMHWLASGLGIAFGKVAELTNVLDIGFRTRFIGGILHPELDPDTDLNDVKASNTYVSASVGTYSYGNCPIKSGTFTLEVEGAGKDGQIHQIVTSCDKNNPARYERYYYSGAWGDWLFIDQVIETGNNGSSAYRKWSSGLLEAWKVDKTTVSVTSSQAHGNLYYTPSSSFITSGGASQFISIESVQVTINKAGAVGFWQPVVQSWGTSNGAATVSYFLTEPRQNVTASVIPCIYIIGKWK